MQFRKNSSLRRLLAASVSVLMLTGTLPGLFNDFANIPIAAQAEETASIDFADGPVIISTTGYQQGGIFTEYTGEYVFKGNIANANPLTFVNDTNKATEFNVTFDGDVNIVGLALTGNAVTIKGDKTTTVNVQNNGNSAISIQSMGGDQDKCYTFSSEVNSIVNITDASGKSVDFGENPSTSNTRVYENGFDAFPGQETSVTINNRYFFFFPDLIQGVYVNNEQVSSTGGFMPSSYMMDWGAEATVITKGKAKFNGVALEPETDVVDLDENCYLYQLTADEDINVEPALTLHMVQPATCEQEGMNYYFSSDDNKYFADYLGLEPIEDLSTLVIPKLEHNIVPTPTTTFMGQTANEKEGYYKCTNCGKYYTDAEGKNEVDASEVVIAFSDTDTSIGSHEHEYDDNGFCKECGEYQPAEVVDDVWQISNAGQLYWFAQQVKSGHQKDAVLTKDIVIQEITFDEDGHPTNTDNLRSWFQIGDGSHNYKKTFDGCGHTVSGIYGSKGFFGYTSGATIQNLGILNSYITKDGDTGSIVGTAYSNTLIQNCYSFATISAEDSSWVGGLFGDAYNNGFVFNCYFAGTLLQGDYSNAIGPRPATSNNCWYYENCGKTSDYSSSFTAEDLTSGKLAYELNKNADALTYYQTLGEDAYPTLNSTKKVVHRANGNSGDIEEYTNQHTFVRIDQREPSDTEPGIKQNVWFDEVCHKYYTDDQGTTEISEDDLFVYPEGTIEVDVISENVTEFALSTGWEKDSEDGTVSVYKGKKKNATATITSDNPIAIWECIRVDVDDPRNPANASSSNPSSSNPNHNPDPIPEETATVLVPVDFVETTITSDGVYTATLEPGKIYEIGNLFDIRNDGTITAYYGPGVVIKDYYNRQVSGDKILIPETIDGITVKAIGKEVFSDIWIDTISFPSTLEVIGDGAFYGTEFEDDDLDLSNTNIKMIGKAAFEDCDLDNVVFPETLEVIGIFAFCDNDIEEIVIPKSVKAIAFGAFFENDTYSIKFETEEDGTSALEVVETMAFSLERYYGSIRPTVWSPSPVGNGLSLLSPSGAPAYSMMGMGSATVTVPACRIDGMAFGTVMDTSDLLSLRIVVTKNGDRPLDMSNTVFYPYMLLNEIEAGTPTTSDIYEKMETIDIPAKLFLAISSNNTNSMAYFGNSSSINRDYSAAPVFIEEGITIKDLGAYAEGGNAWEAYNSIQGNVNLFPEADPDPEVDITDSRLQYISLYMQLMSAAMGTSGRYAIFSERLDPLRTVCIEEENIGTGFSDSEKAQLRPASATSNAFDFSNFDFTNMFDMNSFFSNPVLNIFGVDYTIVRNYNVLIDPGKGNSYLVAAMRNTLAEAEENNFFTGMAAFYGAMDIEQPEPTEDVINPLTKDEFVRFTEGMPYVILSTSSLDYEGTKETTDTPNRTEISDEKNTLFNFSEITAEQLETLKTEYLNLYKYITDNMANGYMYVYVADCKEDILAKDNYHIIKHTPNYEYFVNKEDPSKLMADDLNDTLPPFVYAELKVNEIYYIGDEMPNEKNVEFVETPDTPDVTVRIKMLKESDDLPDVKEVTEEGTYFAEATIIVDGVEYVLVKDFLVKERPSDTDSEPAGTDSGTNGTDSETNGTDSEPNGTDSEPAGTDSEPNGTDSEPNDTDSEPKGTDSEPKNTDTEPNGTDSEPKNTDSDESPDKPYGPGGNKPYLMGDVDFDGKITAKDSLLIMRKTINLYKFNNIQELVGDVNNDGKISNADAMVVLRYSIKLPVSGSVGKKVYL